MKKLRDLLRPGLLATVSPRAAVAEAVHTMARRNVAIVAVVDGDTLVGVFSERDVVERVVDCQRDPLLTPVQAVMTRDLIVGDVDEDYRVALKRIEQAGLRHLPVVSDGRILSMISIRDLLVAEIQDADEALHYFQEYVCLVPPGATVLHGG